MDTRTIGKCLKLIVLVYKKHVFHSVLSLLLATTLVGCATTATIDEEERNTLVKASSVSTVLYPHAPFIVTTAMSAGLAGVFGTSALTAGSDAQRGRDLIQRHRLPDPSTLVIDYFSAGLEAAYGLKNLDDTPSLQFTNGITALRSAVDGGLAFDFRTFYWQGRTQLGKKAMDANIQARLLDLNTGEVLWERACSGTAKGSKETWENTADINSVASDVAQECTQELLESFVEGVNLATALDAVEGSAVNWKKEMGETAAEIQQKHMEQMMNVSLIGNWKGELHHTSSIALDMRMQVEEQDAELFRGHASISGSSISCKGSQVTLSPGAGNSYEIAFTGGGCNGKGKLEYLGDTVKGKIKFNGRQGFPIPFNLVRSQ